MFLVSLKDRYHIARRADLELQIAKGGTPQEVTDWGVNLRQVKREQAMRIIDQVKHIRAQAVQGETPELARLQKRRARLTDLIHCPLEKGKKGYKARQSRWRQELAVIKRQIHKLPPADKAIEKLAKLVSLTRTDPDASPRIKDWRTDGRTHLPTALAFAKRFLRSQGYDFPKAENEGESDEELDEDGATAEERYLNDTPQDRKTGAPTTA